MKSFKIFCIVFIISMVAGYAHPTPDIPVRSNLVDKVVKVQIEVDLRFFKKDPIEDPYVFKHELDQWDFFKREEAIKKAQSYIAERVQFEVGGQLAWFPATQGQFKKLGGLALKDSEDPVVIILDAEFKLSEGQKTFVVKSSLKNEWSVEVRNSNHGKLIPREVSLFPGEKSYAWSVQK